MIWFLVWLVGSAFVSYFGNKLNRGSVGCFFGSLILSPFVVLIYLLFAGYNGKDCPKCAEKVKTEAIKCKHCGHDFVSEVKKSTIDSFLEEKKIV